MAARVPGIRVLTKYVSGASYQYLLYRHLIYGCHSMPAAVCPGNGTDQAAGYLGEGGGSPVRMRELATRSVMLLAVWLLPRQLRPSPGRRCH
jgi:hypothetical protein